MHAGAFGYRAVLILLTEIVFALFIPFFLPEIKGKQEENNVCGLVGEEIEKSLQGVIAGIILFLIDLKAVIVYNALQLVVYICSCSGIIYFQVQLYAGKSADVVHIIRSAGYPGIVSYCNLAMQNILLVFIDFYVIAQQPAIEVAFGVFRKGYIGPGSEYQLYFYPSFCGFVHLQQQALGWPEIAGHYGNLFLGMTEQIPEASGYFGFAVEPVVAPYPYVADFRWSGSKVFDG